MAGFKDQFALAKLWKVLLLMGKKLISISPTKFSVRKSGEQSSQEQRHEARIQILISAIDGRSAGGGGRCQFCVLTQTNPQFFIFSLDNVLPN